MENKDEKVEEFAKKIMQVLPLLEDKDNANALNEFYRQVYIQIENAMDYGWDEAFGKADEIAKNIFKRN